MQETSLTNRRLIIFLSISGLFLTILSTIYFYDRKPLYLSWLMLTPMISVLFTRILTKEGLKNIYIKPFFKRNKKYYVWAYLLTPIIAFSGAVVYFLLFPDQLNVLGSKFAFQNDLQSTSEYVKSLLTVLPLCILVNPLGGLLSCLGEEFAWRGYLLPKLTEKFAPIKAITLTGLIWGIWHAPIILMGFNYGKKHTLLGVVMMIIFCIAINAILSYLFIKTNSIWVVVVAHSAVNAIDNYSPAYLFTSMSSQPNLLIGPNLVGIIGGMGFLVVAFFCYQYFYRLSKF
ncbi:type II CAAX endopeptidase family protein [Enterococcus gilvus]|uniref:CPBP family intramembrane glutamic endopeptidase n=1 Tax=Enterococcus gilvus TaxID=160453 RepID=UPI003D6AA9D5